MITNPALTQMFAEAAQASDVVAVQRDRNQSVIRTSVSRLRSQNPQLIYTCARGSSDHAATFAKYLVETRLGIPVVSYAPSVASRYRGTIRDMAGQPFLIISQSGKSPDLLMSAQAAAAAGALVIAFVNDLASPLAQLAAIVVPLCAGPETSVAATKSYIASVSALAQLVAVWADDAALDCALGHLPADLDTAWAADWSPAARMFAPATSLFVLGRGLTLGIAQEAALKFKETCGIHGEAFSIAEVAHGPAALVKPGFPLLVFPPVDERGTGLEDIITRFGERSARIAIAGAVVANTVMLPLAAARHPVTAPIAMIQSFYRMVNALSIDRGYDPDHPPMLTKVTRTT